MNILLIYGNLVTLAGSENSVLLLAKGLKGLGNRVFFLSGKLEKNKHLADEAFQEKIECPSFFLERPFWAPSTLKTELKNLDAFIQKNNIEVLHIHCPIRNEAFRALNKKYKVVFTAHVAVCPTKSRYLWTQERPCTKKLEFLV